MTNKERINKLEGIEKKFVQIYINKEPYLRFAKEEKFHYEILENILNEFELSYKEFEGVISKKGSNYELVSAGKAKLSEEEIILFGLSVDYEMRPNKKHLKELLSQVDYKIKIR